MLLLVSPVISTTLVRPASVSPSICLNINTLYTGYTTTAPYFLDVAKYPPFPCGMYVCMSVFVYVSECTYVHVCPCVCACVRGRRSP